MSFLQPPKSRYTNFYEQEKFKLTWKLCIWILITMTVLLTYQLITEKHNPIIIAGGFLIDLAMIVTLQIKRTYKPAAAIALILVCIIIQADITFNFSGIRVIANLSWIFTSGLFFFYTLGSPYGIFSFLFNISGLFLGLAIHQTDLEPAFNMYSTPQVIDVIINVSVSTIVAAFLMSKILRSSKIAELSYHSANKQLSEQNEIVQAQNEEKTVMLKEIHHRVKNNLQVITSLLRLQSKELTDPESITHFREAINRVMAMALIHDKLYQTRDFSKIDLRGYLKSLANDLITSYSVEIPVKVKIETDVDHLVPKSLVSVALLFNELISNSLKHGFESIDEGVINIKVWQSVNKKGQNQIEMIYSDNGIWKTPRKETSFGTDLIETLTAQLDGEFDLKTERGAHYHFRFILTEDGS